MRRRQFMESLGGAMVLPWSLRAGQTGNASTAAPTGPQKIMLPDLPKAAPLDEVVLFAFDDRAFPFQNHIQPHLFPARNGRIVLRHGEDGSYDEILLYYGTVIRIGDTFHMWYNGNYGPVVNNIGYERKNCAICYATSHDGENWEKPNLGLVQFNGSRKNNLVDLTQPHLWSTCGVIYDPEDPDPQRKFKMIYEAGLPLGLGKMCVAFSPDGLRWKPYERNPVGPELEMAGTTKFRGMYYVNGQDALGRANRPLPIRRLVTFASADYMHWSPCGALGLDHGPDVSGPSMDDDTNQYTQVHLGAGLWNRGNVILGIYGLWHGHFSGDRRLVTMDLGLAVSHDAIHFKEPIPGFRIVPAREQRETIYGEFPALMQGQGMENFGDKTMHWFSTWRGVDRGGVRMVSWPRDRMGMLKPFRPSEAQAISCPIRVMEGRANVYVNASGLGEHSRLRVGVLDEGFRPVPGFTEADATVLGSDGFRIPVRWKGGDSLLPSHGLVRLDVRFEGVRPEDCKLHAIYLGL